MKIIAHRGNINGPNIDTENKPEHLIEILKLGYDCEIDVHLINNELFLGHDSPTYKINLDFLLLNSSKFWIHCKNMEALDFLHKFPELNIFWHENDKYTITSKQYIWSYIGTDTTNNIICVMPEMAFPNFVDVVTDKILNNKLHGLCTDYCSTFQNIIRLNNKK
jgi:hypothetical protein